jgi:uncharacterized protein YqjF (DUF2071 family)
MANYEIDPEILLPYLPKYVELIYIKESIRKFSWFYVQKTRLFNVLIPYFGNFEEINLRFYVVRKEGNELKRGGVLLMKPFRIQLSWNKL